MPLPARERRDEPNPHRGRRPAAGRRAGERSRGPSGEKTDRSTALWMRRSGAERPERGRGVGQHAVGVRDDHVGAARQRAQQALDSGRLRTYSCRCQTRRTGAGLTSAAGDVRLEPVAVHDGRAGVAGAPLGASSGSRAARPPLRVRGVPDAGLRDARTADGAGRAVSPSCANAAGNGSSTTSKPSSRQRSASGPGPGVTTVMRQAGSSVRKRRQQRQQAGLRAAERRRRGQAHEAGGRSRSCTGRAEHHVRELPRRPAGSVKRARPIRGGVAHPPAQPRDRRSASAARRRQPPASPGAMTMPHESSSSSAAPPPPDTTHGSPASHRLGDGDAERLPLQVGLAVDVGQPHQRRHIVALAEQRHALAAGAAAAPRAPTQRRRRSAARRPSARPGNPDAPRTVRRKLRAALSRIS